MNSIYQGVFKFVRWMVAGLILLIASLPAFTAIGASV